jgi:glycosyltransferase involved in cell wall biosynthesis
MQNTQTSPRVSIILPTHNRAKYIVETVKSVCQQTYEDWELWVIDDQSTDNTPELIKEISDKRVRLYQTEKRLGVTGTRNEGLRKAEGEWIAFIDSDDIWDKTKLEKQITALYQYPEAGFSLTGGFNFRNQLEPVDFYYKQKEGIRYGDLLIPFFESEVSTTTPSLVFRKQCLLTTGFFNEVKSFADVDFILCLARHFKGIILYEPLLFRRLHDSNISKSGWEEGYAEGVELIRSYKDILPHKVTRNALYRLYMNFGEDCLAHKKRSKALKNFLSGWKIKPFSIVSFKKIAKAILWSALNK